MSSKSKIRLGVNIDHIATVRQARGTDYPSPLMAAKLAEQGGADGITLHIREDRRHIQEQDLRQLRQDSATRYINLEMALTDEMLEMAIKYRPQACCIVPEKREELTTEGGLDVVGYYNKITRFVNELSAHQIEVSLFIDPIEEQIKAAQECGAPVIELHTGEYSEYSVGSDLSHKELERLQSTVAYADNLGLVVNAGHGLHYENVQPIAKIPQINELNIGHSIVAEALMVGFKEAVQRMHQLIITART
jgi:pyridoxine 5-phosphate synthase